MLNPSRRIPCKLFALCALLAAGCSSAAKSAAAPDIAVDVAVDAAADTTADVAANLDAAADATADVAANLDAAADTAVDAAPPDTAVQDAAPDAAVDVAGADVPAPDATAADAADSGGSKIKCGGEDASFPVFSKACQSDGDCFVAVHQVNCCGTSVALGVAQNDAAAFLAAEAECEQQYPACGCAQMPTQAEDGFTAKNGDPDIAVQCVAGACTTSIKSAKLDCKDQIDGFPKPFKVCQKQSDCAYVLHTSDCCGTQVALGIAKSAKDAYEKAEATCSPQIAICDCLPKATTAEDGASAGDGMLAVQCSGAMCVSYVKL